MCSICEVNWRSERVLSVNRFDEQRAHIVPQESVESVDTIYSPSVSDVMTVLCVRHRLPISFLCAADAC